MVIGSACLYFLLVKTSRDIELSFTPPEKLVGVEAMDLPAGFPVSMSIFTPAIRIRH